MGILSQGGKEVVIQNSQYPSRTQKSMTDEEDRITKQDLMEMQKRIARESNKKNDREGMLQAGRKGFNAVRSGLHDVAESLNTPNSKKRPRIARIPNLRRAGISQTMDLDKLKHPGLKGRTLQGKREKPLD